MKKLLSFCVPLLYQKMFFLCTLNENGNFAFCLLPFVLASFQASATPRPENSDSDEKDALFGLDTQITILLIQILQFFIKFLNKFSVNRYPNDCGRTLDFINIEATH
jgi:hypothetical protein